MPLALDGGAKGYLKGADSPKENATAAFDCATDSEFSSACSTKNESSLLVGRRYLCSIFHCSAR
jgi:hypothetical protein